MNFPRFGELRKRIFHISARPREGSPEQRGRVIDFPQQQQHSVLAHGGLAEIALGERAIPGIVAGANIIAEIAAICKALFGGCGISFL